MVVRHQPYLGVEILSSGFRALTQSVPHPGDKTEDEDPTPGSPARESHT